MVSLFNVILDNLKERGSVTSTLWKASIKTLIKLLQYTEVVRYLSYCESEKIDLDKLIGTILEAHIDPVDHSEEEQKLLLK